MTTLLDKSTPVPVVKGFHLPNLTPKAHAYRGKSLNENHPYKSGIGGREVGTQKSVFIQKNYASGVNHNSTRSRSRYCFKEQSSTHEHRLLIASKKLKITRCLSIWLFPQTENLSPGSWHPPDRRNPVDVNPLPPIHPRPGKSTLVHTFTPIHFQEFIL